MDTDKHPQPTGETVDTWQMVVIHKWFKREFSHLPTMIRGVAAGDRTRAEYVAEFVELMTTFLHHHHEGEDELLWPQLLRRAGGLDSDLVRRMEKQHEVVGNLLELADTLVPRWRHSGDKATGEKLADVLDQMSRPLIDHLDEEEQEILPLISIYVTQAEWDAWDEYGKNLVPKGGKGFDVIGMLMQDATPHERARFLGRLPAPVRLIYKLVGVPIHRRATARRHLDAA
jgi:hemerythrin-like domain-containing protein